jgi:hypothetical protein
VITVERHGSHYHFHVRPFEAYQTPLAQKTGPVLFTEHPLEFNSSAAAATFLRRFTGSPFAVRRLQSLLSGLGLDHVIHELPEQWIERLAPHLACGRVGVIQLVPHSPAGPSTEGRQAPAQTTPPPPRKDATPPPVEQPDAPTFADPDEDAQVQTLVEAAQTGVPFCEACARAAAAARSHANAAPTF